MFHTAGNDHDFVLRHRPPHAVEGELDLAVQEVVGLVLELVPLLGVSLARQNQDDAFTVGLAVNDRDRRRAELAETLDPVVVRHLELQLRRHDRARGFEHRLGVAHDAVDDAARVGRLDLRAQDRLVDGEGAGRPVFRVFRKVLADELARGAGDRQKHVVERDDLARLNGAPREDRPMQITERALFRCRETVPPAAHAAHRERAPGRFQPTPDLRRRRRIGIDGIVFRGHADVFFKQRRTLGHRQHHGFTLVGRLVGRITDLHPGVAFLEQLDLVELQIIVGGRVFAHAVHDRELFVPVLIKADDPVDILKRLARGRNHQRQLRGRDFFRQRPIREVATGHLEKIVAVLDDLIDRQIVPRRAHRQKPVFHDGVFDPAVVVPTEGGLRKPLYEFQVGPLAVVRVDEVGQVPVLELHRKAEGKARTGLAQLAHDPDPMGDIAHVVVGHLKNKQRRLGRHAE